jgi:hypothetical protein
MVGFTLMHTVGIIVIPLFFAALLWAVITLIVALVSSRQRRAVNLVSALVVIALALPVFAPYGFWVRMFASRIAGGPHAVSFLVHMAALGDIPAVDALLNAGVPINASNNIGLRAIEAAENEKKHEMHDYLAKRGGTDKRF